MVNFVSPLWSPFVITQTYKEHLDYAAAHPEIVYNGGIDLYSDCRMVRAAFDGTVEKVAYQSGGYGNYIKIRHDDGFSLYAHLARIHVNVGDLVIAGQNIGEEGSTGFSTGIHLHFELRDLQDKVQDPTPYFIEKPTNHDVINAKTRLVAESGGNLRLEPLGAYMMTIPYGTIGRILDGPVWRDGLPCYQVEFPITGWMAERDHFGTIILEDFNGNS